MGQPVRLNTNLKVLLIVTLAPPISASVIAEKKATVAPPAVVEGEAATLVPMPGIIIRYEVEVGEKVEAGDTVVIVEAMKMQNNLPAPTSEIIKALNFKPGDKVNKDDVLAIIGTEH